MHMCTGGDYCIEMLYCTYFEHVIALSGAYNFVVKDSVVISFNIVHTLSLISCISPSLLTDFD